MATVTVSDDVYNGLNRVVGRLTRELGRPVSLDELLDRLLRSWRSKLRSFQGAWKMSMDEFESLFRTLEWHESKLE